MQQKITNLPKIVLPEGVDERVLCAAQELIEKEICHPVLIGDVDLIKGSLGSADLYTALAPDASALVTLKAHVEAMGKVFPVEDAALVQGAILVRDGLADGIVGGAIATTTDVFRVYAKTIGVKKEVSRITSCFLMEKDGTRVIFADCGLNPTSNAQQLAETAYLSADFAKTVGIEPKVGFLSFQTVPYASNASISWIADAVSVARETYNIDCDGPLQFDSAFVRKIAASKMFLFLSSQTLIVVILGTKLLNGWVDIRQPVPCFLVLRSLHTTFLVDVLSMILLTRLK